jgi:uncharacterized membrane protein
MTTILIVLIIIVILILVTNRNNSQVTRHEQLLERINNVSREIRDLRRDLLEQRQPQPPFAVPVTPAAPAAPSPPPAIPVQRTAAPLAPAAIIEAPSRKPAADRTPEPPKAGWFDTWLRNNPDMEKFIGENLINKIGISVLVLGIAFFVKYAIDKEWINETGRVLIGFGCGSLLLALAHRLRNSYRSFSSVLVGGGLSVFYFTIAFAFHQYQLIGQVPAFALMVAVTTFAVLLSIWYDRIELAILATVGGFITPFLLSTGNNNYLALFTYLAILNSGLIVLAYFKRWVPINIIAFLFTTIIFGGWVTKIYWFDEPMPYKDGLLFASVYYAMFFVMHIANHIRNAGRFTRWDFVLILATNSAYFAAGMLLLSHWNNGMWQGAFTTLLAVVNGALAWFFYNQKSFDRNFVYLLIGLSLSFVSLIAPVQFDGNLITLFWAAECVLLLWFYQRTNIQFAKNASLFVALLALISLFGDWVNTYALSFRTNDGVLNNAVVTSVALAAAFIIYYRLLYKEANTFFALRITVVAIRSSMLVMATGILLMVGLLEIHKQFTSLYPATNLHLVYMELYVVMFFVLLFSILKVARIVVDPYVRLAVPLIILLLYTFNVSNVLMLEKRVLLTGKHAFLFQAHWITVLLLLFLVISTITYFKRHYKSFQGIQTGFTWLAAAAIVLLFSIEIRNAYLWISYSNLQSLSYSENLYSKAGLSIVWGLASFTFIWLGLRYRFKPLRVVALMLFGATLVKLFVFDIRNIPPGGKILAFILLGILLLTVSFMYQRLKRILIDDVVEKT